MSRTDVNKIDRVIANSIEIYQKELDLRDIGSNYKALCYHGEKTPSLTISKAPPFLYKCFGCGDSGNVIQFIMRKYKISYDEALEYCMKNNALSLVSPVNVSKVIHKEMQVDWIDKPFDDKAKKYWDKYQLPEEFLRQNNVFQAKKIAFNGKVKKYPEDSTVFIYYSEELDKIKILQIGENVSKEDKWRNFLPNNYLWMLPKEKCEQLWVVKSMKDALCLKYHFGFCTTAVQNEDAKIVEPNMNKLYEISKDLVFCYGADPMAVENCKIIQQKYKTKYFNTNKSYLKYGVQDVADVIDQFGIEAVRKELIKKKFII